MSTNFATWPAPQAIPARLAGLRPLMILLALAVLMLALIGAALLSMGASPAVVPVVRDGLIAVAVGGDIVIYDPDGSHPRPLVATDAEERAPLWSPDGTRLAYRSGGPDDWRLMVVDSDGSHPTVVADDGPGSPVETASWAPDGSALVYSWKEAGTTRLFIAPMDGSGRRPLGDPGLDGWDPDWSPDGSRIAFTARPAGEAVGVFVVDRDGTGLERVSHDHGSGAAFSQPSWSPDGRRILTFNGPDGGHEVIVIDVDAGTEHLVAPDPADDYWPSWSADGEWIVFVREPAAGEPQLVVADAVGGEPRLLPIGHRYAGGIPLWSPDGTRLLVAYKMDAGGSIVETAIFDDQLSDRVDLGTCRSRTRRRSPTLRRSGRRAGPDRSRRRSAPSRGSP